jgi:hypothetical protein
MRVAVVILNTISSMYCQLDNIESVHNDLQAPIGCALPPPPQRTEVRDRRVQGDVREVLQADCAAFAASGFTEDHQRSGTFTDRATGV